MKAENQILKKHDKIENDVLEIKHQVEDEVLTEEDIISLDEAEKDLKEGKTKRL